MLNIILAKIITDSTFDIEVNISAKKKSANVIACAHKMKVLK